MNSFSITRTGTYLTIQDFGRFHLQHLGISSSGAMDQRILKELAQVISAPLFAIVCRTEIGLEAGFNN